MIHCERDERGWRIPRKGTKSYEIYHLLLAGFKPHEITKLYQGDSNSIGVLINGIKHPEVKNARALKYWYRNGKPKNNKNRNHDSRYVRKLVSILGMSYEEARAVELKEREKHAAKIVQQT